MQSQWLEFFLPAVKSRVIKSLTGLLDLDALEQAYIDLLERHEVLRTNFISRGGTPIQFVKSVPENFPIEHLDLTDLPLAEKDREATAATKSNGRKIWDLEHGSVIRAQVISLNPTQHILNTAIHHKNS